MHLFDQNFNMHQKYIILWVNLQNVYIERQVLLSKVWARIICSHQLVQYLRTLRCFMYGVVLANLTNPFVKVRKSASAASCS